MDQSSTLPAASAPETEASAPQPAAAVRVPEQVSIDTLNNFTTWLYDFVVWVLSSIFDLFFREIRPRGAYRIPRNGALIFVAAPHANQFVDPILVMRQVSLNAGRRISFLVAEASLKRKFIGTLARASMSIGVVRAQDNLKLAKGKISIDYETDPLVVHGEGTLFTQQAMTRGLLGLPNSIGNSEIAEIRSDTEILLRKEFKGQKARKLLEKGTIFKTANHVNQTQVYHNVFSRMNQGGCVGIFPEGGSHDRSDLLPLKAGVAVMALGALAEYPDCNVKVVPVGMNYFTPHKFRSRAVIEFGTPIEIPAEMVAKYKSGGDAKREAVSTLLDNVTDGLRSVTVRCSDWDTLMTIQAARRLYRPAGRKIPLPLVVELNRRLLEGYLHYQDNPAIIKLRDNVAFYNSQLQNLGLKDHQVETANLSRLTLLGKLLYRSAKLLVLSIAALPGTILFAPVFFAARRISRQKAAQALKGSTVKIQANDVLATWKLLVAMGLAPVLYISYALIGAWIASYYNWFPSIPSLFLFLLLIPAISSISYSSLIIGETGMDLYKSLRPLALALSPSHQDSLADLQALRRDLVVEVTEVVHSLGPELYPDFKDAISKRAGYDADLIYKRQTSRRDSERRLSTSSVTSTESRALSRVNSATSLADIPLFGFRRSSSHASIQSSMTRSTSSTAISDNEDYSSGPGATSSSMQKSFQSEVSMRIRGAMAERARQRHDDDGNSDESDDE